MEKLGLIRRIDELGRIVIPKEIRKNLRIKSGDCFELYSDDNQIIMKRYSEMENYLETLENLINVIYDLFKIEVILTDNYKIIYIHDKKYEQYTDKELTNSIVEHMHNMKRVISEKNEVLNICIDFSLSTNYILQPFLINGDVIGSIILTKNTEINDKDIFCSDIIYKLLIKYLEQ